MGPDSCNVNVMTLLVIMQIRLHACTSLQHQHKILCHCGCRKKSMSSVDKSLTRRLVQQAVGKAVRTDGKELGEVLPSSTLHITPFVKHVV